MLGAYILAGELKKAAGDHQVAFRNYESLLRRFIEKKQRAAGKVFAVLCPRTKFGPFASNGVAELVSLPFFSSFALGSFLTDSLRLPCYASC